MKSAAAVLFALLFGSIALAGQTGSQGQSSYGVAGMENLGTANSASTIIMLTRIGCPVSLRAQYRADGGLLKVEKSRPEWPAQKLHLIVTNPDSERIVSARVRVHGLSGKGRVTQTLSGQNDADAASTLDVQLAQGPDKEASGDLRAPGIAAILSVELNSVTYEDGSTRSFSGRETCRVAPDKMMLITGR